MADLTLAEALLLVALDDDKGADTANWGGGVEAGLAGALLLELVADGCLEIEDGKLVAAGCEPPRDPLAREATAHEAMLASLLHAYDLVKRVVPKEDRRAASRRAKEIATGDAIGAAVGSAVSDVQAATMVAVVAATTAATSSAVASGGDGGAA